MFSPHCTNTKKPINMPTNMSIRVIKTQPNHVHYALLYTMYNVHYCTHFTTHRKNMSFHPNSCYLVEHIHIRHNTSLTKTKTTLPSDLLHIIPPPHGISSTITLILTTLCPPREPKSINLIHSITFTPPPI